MTKPAPFTKASVRRAIEAARAAGLIVIGIGPDGTVITAGDNPVVGASAAKIAMQTDPYALAAERAHAKTTRKRNRVTS